MSKKPHLLMVINDMAWFWSHRLPLAKAVLGQGWTLSVAAQGAENDLRLMEIGIQGYDIKGLSLLSLKDIFKTAQPQIIHAITLRSAFMTGLVCRVMGKGPVVFTIAGLGSLFSSRSLKMRVMLSFLYPLLKIAFAGKDRYVIFQNPDDQALMVSSGIVQETQTHLIRGSGVDLEAFAFTPVPVSERPVVLFSSRLIREKGIDDFIEAARILKEKGQKARFQVAGNVYPKNPGSLSREEIQKAHDDSIIEWLGHRDDMAGLLARATLVVLPSYYGEGVPKVLLEAAASGRQVITCNTPGCRETVDDGMNGILVPPRNPEALASAIEAMISDPEKCAAYGQAGRQKAEAEFGVEKVVQETLDVYDLALKGKG